MVDDEKMSQTQIKAATILLNKVLPNISSIELAGQIDTDITLKWEK